MSNSNTRNHHNFSSFIFRKLKTVMSAGSITVPSIVPLKSPESYLHGSRKWMIDTNTLVDLHTSTSNCLLFYTLNGTKPDPFKQLGKSTTYKFTKPFTLRSGKRTVKAIAVSRDGSKESAVNTRVFQVMVTPLLLLSMEDNDELLTCLPVNVYDPELHRKLWCGSLMLEARDVCTQFSRSPRPRDTLVV